MKQIRMLLNSFLSILPLPFGPVSKFMAFIQFYYLYEVFATNDTGGFSFTFAFLFIVIWSLLTVAVTFQVLANVTSRRWGTLVLSTLGLLIYSLSTAYTFGAKDALEWGWLSKIWGLRLRQSH